MNEARKRTVLRRTRGFDDVLGPLPFEPGMVPLAAGVQVEAEELSDVEVADLRRDPDVEQVADEMPMKLIEPTAEPQEAEEAAGNTWGIEAVGAHSSGFDGSGVVVAVLDTGINPSHEAFQGVALERRNFTDGGDDDENGHGTHCAGTIFGRDIDGLRIGVARGVEKALIGKVLGPGGGSTADIASAINWAFERGANVISMSLGIDFPGFVKVLHEEYDYPIPAATSIALEQYRANVNLFNALSRVVVRSSSVAQACVIVAASGNESRRPEYKIAVAPPAAGEGIVSVGALQASGVGEYSIASFSNTQCNLCGPGVGVTSAWIGGNKVLRSISGTSMATPHVAGCAALWAQQIKQVTGGHLSSENLAARLVSSTELVDGAAFQDVGNGLVKAPQG